MNRSEIRTLVRMFINEPEEGFWTNTELNNCIDLADKKLNATIKSLNNDFFTKSSTFSTVAGTRSYTLPTDFISMRRLEHYSSTDNSEITQIPQGDFPEIERRGYYPFADTDKPYRYIIIGTRMDLYPVPDGVYTCRIYYEYFPSSLSSDEDTPDSPSEFHDMICYWAAVLALPKNGESPENYKMLWKDRVEDLINFSATRKGSDPAPVLGYMENY